MREVRCLLRDADAQLEQLSDDCADSRVILEEEDFQILCDAIYARIPQYNLRLYSGLACIRDEEDGEFYPDFCVTIICEDDCAPEDCDSFYWEQDDWIVALHNYLYATRHINLDYAAMSDEPCCLVVPDESQI